MADGENKRADAAEPLLKRPRLLDPRGDPEHGAAGGTEPVEAEPALLDESHHQASLNNNNNHLTEPEPEAEPEPEPELSGTALRSSVVCFDDSLVILGVF